ncbi:unnamed protein product [Cunninghamella blakesleeana]
MKYKDNTTPIIVNKFETMAHENNSNNKNMTTSSWQSNTLDDSFDYPDSFSQTFLSPMSTTLQDIDDLDYSSSTTTTTMTAPTSMINNKKKLVQALPVYEEPIPDYSSTSSMIHFVGPMDIHHQKPQRHSMLASGSKQYNVFMNQPIQHQPFHHQPSPTSSSNMMSGFTSFSPPNSSSSTSTNFPMSAPANIGYEFNLNSSNHNGSPTTSTIHTVSPTNTLSMNLPSHQQQQPTDLSQNIEDDYAMQINLQAMMEKRRRRRESHNAVERRRRENINDRIQELGSLLPQAMLDEITNGGSGPHSPSTSTGHPSSTTTTIAGGNNISGKPNKGAILRKSVDHIKLLQQEVKSYQQRVKELESTLARYNHHSK